MPLAASTNVLDATFPIVQSLTPALPIGTLCYFQNGKFGSGKGLLLALTNTPIFIKMLMTSNGLQKVN